MIHIKTFNDLTNQEMYEIFKLRQNVFILEQKIYVEDIDDYDKEALHVFIKDNGKIVSYLRLIEMFDGMHVGRVVTDSKYRNQRYATKLINYLQERYTTLILSAQVPVIEFYKKFGFKVVGNKYKEATILHQKMVYIK
ncbi:GNAT family N-acetyltransferase [Acholeplasma equifetale]|uniref:GNAT family N-acetyltransferase n=1 Tax=Acholeplasma equifetale TaxID=264634 RepID=UPI000550301A|nr:GNAT family N-acetyltransferase [Acholeplasma equifetale]